MGYYRSRASIGSRNFLQVYHNLASDNSLHTSANAFFIRMYPIFCYQMFAECLIHKNMDVMVENFNVDISMSHLVAQLFKHGCEKQINGYETNFDVDSQSVRRGQKMKGLVNK